MRAPLERLTIAVEGERATEHPKVFTKIHVRYEFAGDGLQREHVEKAVSLSMEKYCSVSAMLKKSVEVTHEIVLLAGQPGAAR
jgi:putative redox protein